MNSFELIGGIVLLPQSPKVHAPVWHDACFNTMFSMVTLDHVTCMKMA